MNFNASLNLNKLKKFTHLFEAKLRGIMFISRLFSDPSNSFMYLLVIVFSICMHEYMHAQVALWQGDSTAADQGHLTLNPLKQMGVISIIMLLVIGFAFGSVPVNPAKMKHKYSNALVAFAGPFANLVLFFLFIVFAAFAHIYNNEVAVKMFLLGAVLNFVLFCFNMVPIPPLDGYGIFSSFFPNFKNSNSELINGATIFIFIALMFSADILFKIAGIISFKLFTKIVILIS